MSILATIGAGLGLGAGLTGGILGYQTAKENNKLTKQQMAEQAKYNDWYMNYTENQYQKTVEDLKKAGLSPALAISNGSNGASSISAMSNPGLENPGEGFSEFGKNFSSTGIALEQLVQQKNVQKAQIDNLNAQTALYNRQSGHLNFSEQLETKNYELKKLIAQYQNAKTDAERKLISQNLENAVAELDKLHAEISNLNKQGSIQDEEIVKMQTENESMRRELERMRSNDSYKNDSFIRKILREVKGAEDRAFYGPTSFLEMRELKKKMKVYDEGVRNRNGSHDDPYGFYEN